MKKALWDCRTCTNLKTQYHSKMGGGWRQLYQRNHIGWKVKNTCHWIWVFTKLDRENPEDSCNIIKYCSRRCLLWVTVSTMEHLREFMGQDYPSNWELIVGFHYYWYFYAIMQLWPLLLKKEMACFKKQSIKITLKRLTRRKQNSSIWNSLTEKIVAVS